MARMSLRPRHGLLGALTAFSALLVAAGLQAPSNNFSFSIVGDRTGGPTPGVYEQVWREVSLLGPDFVINTGDTIDGQDDSRAVADWDAVRRVWERYGNLPRYFTPGNHDIWSEASQRLYEKVTGRPASYGFDFEQAHFTVLDNSRTLDLDDAQLRFLESDLRKNRQRDPKFVFFHKPFWIVYLKVGSGEFALHRLAKQYGVDYVVSGHAHQFFRMERDGVVYLSVGSSGASLERGLGKGEGFAQGWFHHHVWVRVRGPKVDMTVKELDAPYGKGRMFRVEDWGADGPVFDPSDPASGRP